MTNTENLFVMTTACVLNQSDKIICPYPTVLCKGLPSYLSNVAASDQKALFLQAQLSAFNVQLNHHLLHNLLFYPPLPTPVPPRNNPFLLYSHST